MPNRPPYYLGLCAIAKDEGPFLREWLAYHYLLGFERFYIFDNDSQVPVADIIGDMLPPDMLTIYPITGKTMQLIAYNHCLSVHGAECEWLAFFDLDEFFLPLVENDARIVLSDFENHGALCLNMCNFGSAGHLARPSGLVLENYREKINIDIQIKCIVRPGAVKFPLTPHNFVFNDGFYAVNADGIPAYGGFSVPAVDRVRLNHYSFRSQQDYEEKIARGDAVFKKKNPRLLQKFYRQALAHSWKDDHIQRFVPQVRALLSSFEPRKNFSKYIRPDDLPLLSNTYKIRTDPYETALRRLARLVENSKVDRALLIFSLNRARFRNKASYLMLGVHAYLAAGYANGARTTALNLLAIKPEPTSFLALAKACLSGTARDEGLAIASFLKKAAQYTRDAQLNFVVRELIREFKLDL